MRITTNSGQLEISYSVTPQGYFCQTIKRGKDQIIKSTSNVTRFVNWMSELEPVWNDARLRAAKKWWRESGHFNTEHYKKVMEARKSC